MIYLDLVAIVYELRRILSILKAYIERIRTNFAAPHMRVGVLVFLVSSAMFALGYIAGRDWHETPLVIEQCAEIR